MLHDGPIIALATPPGMGAIAVIRLSGTGVIALASPFFKSAKGKDLALQKSHTLALGHMVDGDRVVDEVLVSVFKGPNSYTGEDVVELSCHGSPYIQQQLVQLFLRNGCRMAQPGEFTLRAFLNGKMDLSQAEAVADLVASDNAAAHQTAMQQMRGGFSHELKKLRDELVNFAALIELELDFSQEDVEFADRQQFDALLDRIQQVLKRLLDSFALGNVIKKGIAVAIVGEPNVGKSTLLNALLNEERAIVSEIAGTTRDSIEDEINLGGFGFRFIDTAGIRETRDVVEGIGIKKTFEKIREARAVLYLIDGTQLQDKQRMDRILTETAALKKEHPEKPLIPLVNKMDRLSRERQTAIGKVVTDALFVSAKTGEGLKILEESLLRLVNTGALRDGGTVVTNGRHFDALQKALEETDRVRANLAEGVSADLLAVDLRQALAYLGEITGEITTDELLGSIFSSFCIGK